MSPMFDMKWVAAVLGTLIVLWLCFCGLVKLGQAMGTHGPEPPGLLGMLVGLAVLYFAARALGGQTDG